MSRKQRKRGGGGRARMPAGDAPEPSASGTPRPEAAPEKAAPLWTDDFLNPRPALAVAGALLAYSGFIYFFFLTRVMAVDQALVLWAGGCVAGLAVIHPAFAMGFMAFLRHWVDGITYPSDNLYFLAGCLLIFVVWAGRLLLRGGVLHARTPAALLAGFVLVAWLTSFSTVQQDNTNAGLLLWCGYLALFLTASNCLRNPLALGVALGGAAAAVLSQSIYSVLHYEHILPVVRQMVMDDPNLLRQYFNEDTLTPELERRLTRDRAFGTMLFPNALGALLTLGIPLSLFGAWRQFDRLRAHLAAPDSAPAGRWAAIGCGLAGWFLSFLPLTSAVWFHTLFAYPDAGMLDNPVLWLGGAGLIPIGLGLGMFQLARSHGPGASLRAGAGGALTVTLLAGAYALYLSRSRGAMLGLALAMVITALLMYRAAGGMRGVSALLAQTRTVRAAAAVLVVIAGAAATWTHAGAGWASEMPPPAGVAQVQGNTPEIPAAPETLYPGITLEGEALPFSEMMTLATFFIRLTYWKVGWTMALDNFWTGVGLGNFGVAYPKYQYFGAGDVQTAHNDYLQAFAETGFAGFLLLTGFALYFGIHGGRRLLNPPRGTSRLLLAGLYCGGLAFCLHSIVDFNFSNPALMYFAFLLIGAYYAQARTPAPPQAGTTLYQALMIPGLLLAALVFGLAGRSYHQHFLLSQTPEGASWLNVGNQRELDHRYEVGRFFFSEVFNYAHRRDTPPPAIAVRSALRMLPSREAMMQLGDIRVASPGAAGGTRRVGQLEALPPNAFFVVLRPFDAFGVARDEADQWLRRIIEIDAIAPHSPELADHIAQWYALLHTNYLGERERDRRARYLAQYVAWSRETVERSPVTPGFRFAYGQALWRMARDAARGDRRGLLMQGLEQYRTGLALYPVSAQAQLTFAHGLQQLAYQMDLLGLGEEARKLRDESVRHFNVAENLMRTRGELGLP